MDRELSAVSRGAKVRKVEGCGHRMPGSGRALACSPKMLRTSWPHAGEVTKKRARGTNDFDRGFSAVSVSAKVRKVKGCGHKTLGSGPRSDPRLRIFPHQVPACLALGVHSPSSTLRLVVREPDGFENPAQCASDETVQNLVQRAGYDPAITRVLDKGGERLCPDKLLTHTGLVSGDIIDLTRTQVGGGRTRGDAAVSSSERHRSHVDPRMQDVEDGETASQPGNRPRQAEIAQSNINDASMQEIEHALAKAGRTPSEARNLAARIIEERDAGCFHSRADMRTRVGGPGLQKGPKGDANERILREAFPVCSCCDQERSEDAASELSTRNGARHSVMPSGRIDADVRSEHDEHDTAGNQAGSGKGHGKEARSCSKGAATSSSAPVIAGSSAGSTRVSKNRWVGRCENAARYRLDAGSGRCAHAS